MKGPFAHPPKIPAALNKPGVWGLQAPSGVTRGNALFGCPGVQTHPPPHPIIVFNHFLCAQTASPGVLFFFFIIINFLFSPSETNKKTKC